MRRSRSRKRRARRRTRDTGNLNDALRKLLNEWRLAILEENERKCAVCGKKRKGRIHIHHTTPFHTIRNEVFIELNLDVRLNIEDYSPEEIQLITEKLIEKHKTVVGIPMHKKIHKLFHSEYGMNATLEDYYEFKKRWDAGEWNGKIIIY